MPVMDEIEKHKLDFIEEELKLEKERFIIQTFFNNKLLSNYKIQELIIINDIKIINLSLKKVNFDLETIFEVFKHPKYNYMLECKKYYEKLIFKNKILKLKFF